MPTTKAVRKRATKSPAKRRMTAAHKRALAEGRAMSATVDRYLAAVNAPKRRGRKVSKARLEQRLEAARVRVQTSSGVDKVVAAQEVRNLQDQIAALQLSTGADIKMLESAFVGVAKKFGENRGVGYGAWRDAGVSAQVLKRAGIARTGG